MSAKPYKPACPSVLDGVAGAKALWTRTVNGMVESGRAIEKGDVPAITRYVRALLLAARCWTEVDADYERTGTLKGRGSQGQPVTDPLVDSALKAEKHAAEFAKALGLEPAARVEKNRGGRPRGNAKPRLDEPPMAVPLRAVK